MKRQNKLVAFFALFFAAAMIFATSCNRGYGCPNKLQAASTSITK